MPSLCTVVYVSESPFCFAHATEEDNFTFVESCNHSFLLVKFGDRTSILCIILYKVEGGGGGVILECNICGTLALTARHFCPEKDFFRCVYKLNMQDSHNLRRPFWVKMS